MRVRTAAKTTETAELLGPQQATHMLEIAEQPREIVDQWKEDFHKTYKISSAIHFTQTLSLGVSIYLL
jgi:hypothetical protein